MKTVEGITIDKSHNGLPMFAHIDLRKHSDLIPILENKGVEVKEPIKWTAKMKTALSEKEFSIPDIDNFWGE